MSSRGYGAFRGHATGFRSNRLGVLKLFGTGSFIKLPISPVQFHRRPRGTPIMPEHNCPSHTTIEKQVALESRIYLFDVNFH